MEHEGERFGTGKVKVSLSLWPYYPCPESKRLSVLGVSCFLHSKIILATWGLQFLKTVIG